jgi:hypothetical protein
MRTVLLSLVAIVGLSYLSAPAMAQEKGGDDRTGPYDVVTGWPQPLPDKGTSGAQRAGFSLRRPTESSSPTVAS